jgi:para-aminobenzoate synthetase/4-amino-4-deoxychorismate lyase
VLLYNTQGQVTESSIANIVVDLDGRLCTPPVHCGLLAGTYRAWLLAQGQIHEQVLSIADVLHSPHVYLINSVRGMRQVRVVGVGGVEDRGWGSGAREQQL